MNSEASARKVSVFHAIETRTSVRSFRNDPIDQKIIEQILTLASRAPSGTNMQPWQSRVLTGTSLQELCTVVSHAFDEQPRGHDSEVRYYPEHWFEPFISRRRKVGWDLYGLLNIEKGDRDRMHAQHRRNYEFFGAPVGMIFTINRDLATGSWLDYGMFLQNVMLAARAFELHTCAQAAWAEFHPQIREHLALPENEIIVCGMALGKANLEAPENQLITDREPLSSNTIFLK